MKEIDYQKRAILIRSLLDDTGTFRCLAVFKVSKQRSYDYLAPLRSTCSNIYYLTHRGVNYLRKVEI